MTFIKLEHKNTGVERMFFQHAPGLWRSTTGVIMSLSEWEKLGWGRKN